MLALSDAASLLEISEEKLQALLVRENYTDENLNPRTWAVDSGFMKADGKIGRRGMTQLTMLLATEG